MAKSTDNEIPRPAKTSLRATPAPFHFIQNHPEFSNQNVAGAPFDAPPHPLHAAIRPNFTPALLSQNVPPDPSHNPPSSSPYSDQLGPSAPAVSSPLHRAIKQTHDVSYPRDVSPPPSSSFSAQPSHLNTPPPTVLQSPLWHTQYSSQYRNIAPRPSNSPPFQISQSQSLDQRRIEFETSSALQRTQSRQVSEAINSKPWIEYEGWNAYEKIQNRALAQTHNNQPGVESEGWTAYDKHQNRAPTEANNYQPGIESEASIALERSQTQALAEAINSQSKVEIQAPNAKQRSPTRATAEIDKLMEDEGLDDISSSDEDFREFKAGLTKAKYDTDIFRASRDQEDPNRQTTSRFRGSGRPKNDIAARGGYRGPRGPRLAAEPTGDIKARLAQASEAFLQADYHEAKAIATEIIRINAETHQAWTMLASCFYELDNRDRALTALTYAAHLEPKNIEGWLHCASVFLEETGTGKRRDKALQSAFFCYSAALKADPKDIPARLGKASIYIERNAPAGAVAEFKKIHALKPHDLDIIVNLCAAYYDHKEFGNARDLYKETFARLRADPDDLTDTLGWSDLNSYIAVYEQLGEYEAAIRELKSLSRWLLGRDSEEFWDNFTKDDREWDSDILRRVEVSDFQAESFPLDRYGDGLPLELRAKLGICRLELGHHDEAMRHFEWLRGFDESGEDKVLNYFDLYRSVADRLQAAELYQHALSFYQPLKQVSEESTRDLYVQMGRCYLKENLQGEAEECFHTAIQLDNNNTEARVQLAKMYESLNEQEQAFIYVNEVLAIKRMENPEPVKARRRRQGRAIVKTQAVESKESSESENEDLTPVKYYTYKRRRLADPKKKLEEERSRADEVKSQYHVFRTKLEGMRLGDPGATRAWMMAARDLTDDFRSVRKFYPYDKYASFLGYKEKDLRAQIDGQTEVPTEEGELSAMADRLSQHLGADIADKTRAPQIEMPSDHRGITFGSWLDIFLEFALGLARHGKMKESYEICEAAKDCALYYTNREDMFLIHICWLTCALLLCDEETCVSVARFFMKDYQFTTDSYRMFTAVTRMVHSPVSWYSSGPSQKYILRQIKAMDYALVDEKSRGKYFTEKGSYSAVDEKGQLIINDDLNIALLMLYGHILHTGSSYYLALNYFLRALALDPENPMINLNVGLAYAHQALKRQAENRQHLILQGLTFLFNYYNSRKTSSKIEERQEAHYNMARVYHMLGLTNLAIPYYDLVFKEIEGGRKGSREDLVTDAAYNLQTIYAMSGNQALASGITRKWLVI